MATACSQVTSVGCGLVIEPRIYRAAFLPTLLALVVAMFSLEARPGPAPQGLAADVLFEGRLADQTLRQIAREHPDRRPGTPGNAAVARLAVERFREHGFDPIVVQRFREGGERLENVVARRVGASRNQIVVMAARDTGNTGPGAATSAADTAALLELARVFEGRSTRRTIVLASLDGSSMGDAGARRFLEDATDRGRIEAVLVLSSLGASSSRGPLLVQWSNDASRGGIGLNRTVAQSVRQELGGIPREEGAPGQIARLALPIGIGAQGVLLAEGQDAVRLSGSGELPPEAEPVNVERLGSLGRAALRAASALDGRRTEAGPSSYVIVARNVLPGWALALVALALLLPPLFASIDALARASRRREPVGRWARWALAGALPPVAGLLLAELLVLAGQMPDAPPAPFPPGNEPVDAGAVVVLGAVVAIAAVSWVLLQPRLRRAAGDASTGGAGAVTSLALALTVLAVWFLNPFAALVLVPATHLWLLAMAADARPWVRGLLFAGGLVGPAGVGLYYLARLSLDPLDGAWYALLLLTGHNFGPVAVLLGFILLALAGSVLAVLSAVARRPGPEPPAGPSVRGPASYAGPGSLGGTDSALGR